MTGKRALDLRPEDAGSLALARWLLVWCTGQGWDAMSPEVQAVHLMAGREARDVYLAAMDKP